ncbi:MAG: sel1 repeat family protein [Kordiimonadaceae bacterium]|nr:sel1 repeat family protein [Kordiimonadaceae bacterium]MBT6030961.1 sel1 repeat family protein [Kordiimonadaceae bacterium]
MKNIVTFIFLISSSFANADIDAGKEAYFMGEYEKAHAEFINDASRGNSYAQVKLGFMYENGWGVTKNYTTAINWYQKAAEQDDPEAHVLLGKLYAYAKGVKRNQKQAEDHLLKAASLGHHHAYYVLGDIHNDIYAFGNNEKAALNWYLMASEKNAGAFLRNGHYSKGRGQWFRLLTVEGIRLTVKAADEGNIYAQFNAGLRYYYGEGIARDYQQAAKYFEISAEAGNDEAQNFMGQTIVIQNFINNDKVTADMWFIISAKNGNSVGLDNQRKLEISMTEEERINAHKRAKNWLESH